MMVETGIQEEGSKAGDGVGVVCEDSLIASVVVAIATDEVKVRTGRRSSETELEEEV